ncbi:MAG: tyrosine-type recombinase/integrase [Candidatus Gracilibacteria bacterium]
MKLNTLIQLFPQDEWDKYHVMVTQGQTPLWKYWEEYVTRQLDLGGSMQTLQNVRSTMQFIVRHMNIYSIEECNNQNTFEDRLIDVKKERRHSGSTTNTILKNIKTYFIWLRRREYILENKLDLVQKSKTVKNAQVAFSKEQVLYIQEAILNQTHTPLITMRNFLFIKLLALTGARPSELLNLKASSLEKTSIGDYVLKITGVKQITKPRVYHIKDLIFAQIFESYMSHRAKIGRSDEALFISSSMKGPWTYQGLRKLFASIAKKVGFQVTAYGFRRYVATNLHTQRLPIEKIAQHLGHTRLSTTMLYIQNSTEHTLEAMTMLESNLMSASPLTLPSAYSNKKDKWL